MQVKNDDISIHNARIQPLAWDSDYFGLTCGKAVLDGPLSPAEWSELSSHFTQYQFLSLFNANSDPTNAQHIGRKTSAFLADVNIQFSKKLISNVALPTNITIHQALAYNEHILEIAEFRYSRFIEDPQFASRGGERIYCEWLKNAFSKPDKHFALYQTSPNEIQGFVLFANEDHVCTIELIAVDKYCARAGIGTDLFKAVEHVAFASGNQAIQVGTQIRNVEAVNFYHKVGCKQIVCNQVYHLWNV
jgi:dTDP-4-amino-4,6-dideoxy-D-galactose acyltransferase